ncbi:MAG: threonine synthase [Bacillota bacterium]|nr:threonine synthase [Bacillota bacterium]
MRYKSTRGDSLITASEAIIRGIGENGGLYIPEAIPKIDKPLQELKGLSYRELCFYILKMYLTDYEDSELKDCIDKAYTNKFDAEDIVPIKKCGDAFFLELYHGPTLAFKDMALSILPHLLKTAAKKNKVDKEIVILTATSGDTGKAALQGFADVAGTKIVVFYPENGTSEIQKRQMVTQKGKNTLVVGIEGNFDDAQRGVKKIFADNEYKNLLNSSNYILSSANSINIGRLLPQIVYYFYGYLNMLKQNSLKENEKINIVVPTGNFGNILAAYFAGKMGLPVNKLICASNENNVLYDFINTGIYDTKREFKVTCSPSMDILVSSNLERLIYYISGENKDMVSDLMEKLSRDGKYEINADMKEALKDFCSGFADDRQTEDTINKVYKDFNYVIDTHTAVAYHVYENYIQETGDTGATIIASTASPFKFTRSVCSSLGLETEGSDDFQLVNKLSQNTEIKIPDAINSLDKMEIIHKKTCSKTEMKKCISEFLKV